MAALPGTGNRLVLAVDIGTSGCRGSLFDEEGRVLREAERSYQVTYGRGTTRRGFAEQDPAQIFDAFAEVVEESTAGYRDNVHRVVLDSMMHTLVLADQEGSPLTPLSIWADTRAIGQCAELSEVHSAGGWQARTGCPLSPSYPLSRLLWYRQERPALFRRFHKAVSIKAYLLFRLFGVWLEDRSLASGSGLFNLHSLQWDAEILERLGLEPGRLPEPVPVEYMIEMPPVDSFRHLLPRKAIWVVGGGDGPLAHLGSTGGRKDRSSLSIGTSCAVRLLAPPDAGARAGIWTYLVREGEAVSGIASNNGGNVLDWYLKKVLKARVDWGTLSAALARLSTDRDLFFFPWLLAERDSLTGIAEGSALLGVRGTHRREDLILAIVEGIVFHAMELHEALTARQRPAALALSGSFTQLAVVREIVAQLFDGTVLASAERHAPQLGSLMLAGGTVRGDGEVVTPRESGYREKYERWREKRLAVQS